MVVMTFGHAGRSCSLITYHNLMDQNVTFGYWLSCFLLSDTMSSVRTILTIGGIRSRCSLARPEDGQV